MIRNISIENLYPHPQNPRKDLGDLTELAQSIKAQGVLQNLTVVPWNFVEQDKGKWDDDYYRFFVLIGHRRLAASKLAGLTDLPCAVVEMTREEQIATMLTENMQRADLTVYEQAQGMQMLMDLGMTADAIAEKTGFSKSTVRRRVKLMELDQEKLREVSSRQIAMADLDRLAQIDDVEKRNECLDVIGTSNFDMHVKSVLRKVAIAKNLPAVKARLKELGAKAIKQSERYGMKYDSVGSHIYIHEADDASMIKPMRKIKKPFYYLDEEYGQLQFYEECKKAEPVRRSPEEIQRDKLIESAWASLLEKSQLAHQLRSDFVKGITVTKKNLPLIVRGALLHSVMRSTCYGYIDNKDGLCEVLGITNEYSGMSQRAVEALKTLEEEKLPALVYTLFGDCAERDYMCGRLKDFPKYDIDAAPLDATYDWLISLGYEMSDEEERLWNGTHELFHIEEANADAGQG